MAHLIVPRPEIDRAVWLEAYDFLIRDSALTQALTLAERRLPDKIPETVERIVDYSYRVKDYHTVLEITEKYRGEQLEDTAINVIDSLIDDNDYETAWYFVNDYLPSNEEKKELILHPYLSVMVDQYRVILQNAAQNDLSKVAPGLLSDIKKMADDYLPRDRFFHYGLDKLKTPEYVKIDDLLESIQSEFLRKKS